VCVYINFILQRDETATAAKLVDSIVKERASLSGPSSPMHVIQQHPLAAISSTTVSPLPVWTADVDKLHVYVDTSYLSVTVHSWKENFPIWNTRSNICWNYLKSNFYTNSITSMLPVHLWVGMLRPDRKFAFIETRYHMIHLPRHRRNLERKNFFFLCMLGYTNNNSICWAWALSRSKYFKYKEGAEALSQNCMKVLNFCSIVNTCVTEWKLVRQPVMCLATLCSKYDILIVVCM